MRGARRNCSESGSVDRLHLSDRVAEIPQRRRIGNGASLPALHEIRIRPAVRPAIHRAVSEQWRRTHAGLAAGLAASAAGWIADIGTADWIAQLGIDLSTTVGLISDTAADAIQGTTGALAGALESGSYAPAVGAVGGTAFAGFVGGIASVALTGPLEGPVSPSQLAKDLLVSGLTAGTGGVLGKLGELSAPQLSALLSNAADGVGSTDPQLASSLLELSRQVAGTTGKISNGVRSSAASEVIVSQHLDAEGFSGDQLQGLLQAIAGGGEGG